MEHLKQRGVVLIMSMVMVLGVPLTVVVFEPQPREFFAGDQAPPRLTRLREKVRLLRDHGAEQVLCLPFNDALRSLTGREFIDQVLIEGSRRCSASRSSTL